MDLFIPLPYLVILFAPFAATYVLWVFLVYVILATKWPAAPGFGRTATAEELGRGLMTTWLLPFEVVSVLLLVALIGAAFLARPLSIRLIEPLGSNRPSDPASRQVGSPGQQAGSPGPQAGAAGEAK